MITFANGKTFPSNGCPRDLAAGVGLTFADPFDTLSESECVKIILQILNGLRFLHGRGVIHRDLKCVNVLLDDDFNVVIGDFGLSKHAQDNLFKTFCGTLGMIAPEVFPAARASLDKYEPKADL